MDYFFDDNEFPLAYLVTLRTYGTWLHGEEKTSVDRHGYNVYKTPRRPTNIKLKNAMLQELKQKPFLLNESCRKNAEEAINEVCKFRNYQMHAINIRSNHLHAVVSAQMPPARIIEAFKSYATRRLREAHLIEQKTKVWARGRSRRYLWKAHHVSLAIEYVLYGQGDIIPNIVDCPEFDD